MFLLSSKNSEDIYIVFSSENNLNLQDSLEKIKLPWTKTRTRTGSAILNENGEWKKKGKQTDERYQMKSFSNSQQIVCCEHVDESKLNQIDNNW